MTKEELKKLNRVELLELLLEQAKVIEKLEQEQAEMKARFEQEQGEMKAGFEQELEEMRAKLEDRELNISQSGSLAEAALKVNDIFAKADAAAKMYLENSRTQANKILFEANLEAERKKKEADEYWDTISVRMERFYQDHAWLRQMLMMDFNPSRAQERRNTLREES